MAPATVIALGLPLYLCLGFFAVPWGIISDRKGAFFALGAGGSLTATGALLMAFSSSETLILISLIVSGIGIAVYHPAGMAAISRNFKEQRGRALATHGIWGGVGILIAPIASGTIAYFLHWRAFFVVACLLSGLTAAWSFHLYKKNGPSLAENNKPSQTIGSFFSSLLKIFKFRDFAILVVTMTLGGMVYRSNTVAIPVLFRENGQRPLEFLASWIENFGIQTSGATPLEASSSMLMALALLGGLLGQRIGGELADRYSLARVYFCYFLFAIPCLFMMGQLSGNPLMIVSLLYFFVGLGMQPIENSLVAKLSPEELISSIYGIKFTFAFGVAALVVYPVSAFVQTGSFSALYMGLAGLLVFHIFLVSRMNAFKETS